ncbi:MAG: caspase family protein [Burkholderiaceae bacterium]
MSKIITLFILTSFLTISAFAQQRNLVAAPRTVDTNEDRIALVIGNSAYQSSPLKNPINDSRAMSIKLRTLGFDVIERENLTQKQVGSVLREFKSKLKPGAVALFFYAGHGLQVRGVNYLPTVDAEIASEEDVPLQSINLNQILELLDESKTRMNLIFLDACRNNPYVRTFRSLTNGLSSVSAPSGTIISFATRPGSVAADGGGNHSFYTEKLLANMDKPMPIEQVLKNVVSGVKAASNGQQEPWMEGSIEGDFYFVSATQPMQTSPEANRIAQETAINQVVEEVIRKAAQMPGAQQQTTQSIAFNIEASYWDTAKNSRDKKDAELYLAKYPNGYFAELAKNRIAALQQEAEDGKEITALAPAFGKTRINYKPGDTYQYQSVDMITGIARKLPKETVTKVTSTDVSYDAGPMKNDLLGNFKVDPTGVRRYNDFPQIFIPEYKVGKTWTSRVQGRYQPKSLTALDVEYVARLSVVGKEIITVPAGTFDTFKITGTVSVNNGPNAEITFWVAPDKLNRYIAYEYRTTSFTLYPESDRIELISFAEQSRAQMAQASNLYGYTIGDRYVTRRLDMYKQEVIGKNEMVIGAFPTDSTIVSLDSTATLKADGSPKLVRYADGSFMEWSDSYVDKPLPENLKVGYKQNMAWTYRFKRPDGEGEESHKGTMEVVGIETVKVPAGQFEAYKIVQLSKFVGKHSWQIGESRGSLKVTNWYVPSIRAIVVSQVDIENTGSSDSSVMYGQVGDQTSSFREELVNYKLTNAQLVQKD